MLHYLCVPVLTKSYTQAALYCPARQGTMRALSLPLRSRSSYQHQRCIPTGATGAQHRECPCPRQALQGHRAMPGMGHAGRRGDTWGQLGGDCKALWTSKGWEACEAACTENTRASVPNLTQQIFLPPEPQEEGKFSSALISQGCLNGLSSDFSICFSNLHFLTYKSRMEIGKATRVSSVYLWFLQKEIERLFAVVNVVIFNYEKASQHSVISTLPFKAGR